MLDINCEEKKLMTEAIVKMLKKMADISNSSLNKNADGLLSRKLAEMKVEWIGKSKTRLLSIKYKVSYWFIFYRNLPILQFPYRSFVVNINLCCCY